MTGSIINLLKENFRITNDCIILATPLVIFILLIQLYVENFQYRLSNYANYISYLLVLWVLISAFLSGWLYMTKKTLQFSKKKYLYELDRLSALKKLFLCLFKGIGRFFPHVLTVTALYFIFALLKTLAMIYLYNSPLKPEFSLLTIIFSAIQFLLCFWFIYLLPEIVYSYKNVFVCIINSLKKVCSTLKQTVLLYIIVYLSAALLYYALVYAKTNPIIYFLELLLAYYAFLYLTLLIFRNYEKNFIE